MGYSSMTLNLTVYIGEAEGIYSYDEQIRGIGSWIGVQQPLGGMLIADDMSSSKDRHIARIVVRIQMILNTS